MKKLKPMSAERMAELKAGFAAATDLYHICPRCKAKRTGTLEALKQGCCNDKASAGESPASNAGQS